MGRVIIFVIVILSLGAFTAFGESEEKECSKAKEEKKYFEVYRVIGKGKDTRNAREDAFQNAVIEFLKENVSPRDLKENSEKILKEIFPSKKLPEFIESHKVIVLEEVEDGVRIVVDVVVRAGKLAETLERIKVPTRRVKGDENGRAKVKKEETVEQ